MSSSDASSSHNRVSSGSSRSLSSRSRSANPQQQLSQIEKSVTHLLVATKQLLETLTSWSRAQATETEVSDVYVRLGYEFNIACRAFNSIGVETDDLGPVPDLLRSILEETLSQDASQASLDKFLPRIRDIIINLLHGLKKKQSRLRQKSAQAGAAAVVAGPSTAASGTTTPSESGPSRSKQSFSTSDVPPREAFTADTPTSARSASTTSSAQAGRDSPGREPFSPASAKSYRAREPSRDTPASARSSVTSATLQSLPFVDPSPSTSTADYSESTTPVPDTAQDDVTSQDNSPQQPPMQTDALAALQRGGDLERRASRRFSAYQIQKHLGTPNGVPIIPPAQNSPIPNRGNRDNQESMNAVRTRSKYEPKKQTSRKIQAESSPLRREPESATRPHAPRQLTDDLGSPLVRPSDDAGITAYPFPSPAQSEELPSAAATGPLSNGLDVDHAPYDDPRQDMRQKTPERMVNSTSSSSRAVATPPRVHSPMTAQQRQVSMSSPQPGRELTLFLQYKSKIKKFVLADAAELTVARLQLAFIEKFAWNTHNNGVDLPEIYIQDPVSGIRHELEDLGDIKERSVLVLNVEVLDEVKRHFDDGVGSLRKVMDGLRSSVEDQQAAITRLSDVQKDSARDIASLAAVPAAQTPTSAASYRPVVPSGSRGPPVVQLEEVQSLRRDLAVVRQVYSSFVSDINASMATIRTKAAAVREKAEEAQLPNLSTDAGRTYVNNGKKSLQEDSERIVTAVDDLQDTVEDLRKDVVLRGVRPLPRQLETLSKDISSATSQLKKLKEYLKKEKPTWTKIWEKELQVVCDDRDLLTMQEDLCVDLEDDLEKAAATFSLVEQATRQQNMEQSTNNGGRPSGGIGTGVRSVSRTLKEVNTTSDPHAAKNGVLGEVKALQPNHESRLEAIERAEKLRQRELEGRREGEFERELGNFVTDNRLKKSGGVEEVERLRKARDDRVRREVWERQAAKAAAASTSAAAAASTSAAAAAAAASGGAPPPPPVPPMPSVQTDTAPTARGSPSSAPQSAVSTASTSASVGPSIASASADSPSLASPSATSMASQPDEESPTADYSPDGDETLRTSSSPEGDFVEAKEQA